MLLRDRRRFLKCLSLSPPLGPRRASANAEDANRSDQHGGGRHGHGRAHGVNERLGEDRMRQLFQLVHDLRRDAGGQLQAAARLAASDLQAA